MKAELDDLRGHPTQSATGAALAGMAALAVTMGIGRFALTPILPMMQDDIGLSLSTAGFLASATYLGNLFGAGFAVTTRVSAAVAISGGLATIGVTTLAMGLGHRPGVWIALRLITGFATAWVLIFTAAWSLEILAPVGRPALQSTVFAGYGVGVLIAGATSLALIRLQAGSAWAWIILGGLALTVAAGTWPIFRAACDTTASEGRREDAARSWDAEAVRIVLCYGAFGFGYIVPATFLPAMGRQIIHDPSVFGWIWPIFGAAAVGSAFAAAGLSGLVANRRLWASGHLVMACGVALPATSSSVVALMLSALLIGGTFTTVTMAGFQAARERYAPTATAIIAAMVTSFSAGQVAGLVLMSYMLRGDDAYLNAVIGASLVLAVSALVIFLPARPSRSDS